MMAAALKEIFVTEMSHLPSMSMTWRATAAGVWPSLQGAVVWKLVGLRLQIATLGKFQDLYAFLKLK